MKKIASLLIAAALTAGLGTSASAAYDYTFKAKNNDDFYRSTLYEDVYGSQYNYGGQNPTDFIDTSVLPGLISPTPQTAQITDGIAYGIVGDYDVSGNYAAEFTSSTSPWTTAFTPVSELKRSDGSIGALVIPSLGINMKAYEGATNASMAKGVGHFAETSGWNGNVALCGHNRGATYTIGTIKNLKTGDTIQYTTTLGTRTYAVTFVGTISSTDMSYLAATSDNRITLITCLADQPSLRVVVQAVETGAK